MLLRDQHPIVNDPSTAHGDSFFAGFPDLPCSVAAAADNSFAIDDEVCRLLDKQLMDRFPFSQTMGAPQLVVNNRFGIDTKTPVNGRGQICR